MQCGNLVSRQPNCELVLEQRVEERMVAKPFAVVSRFEKEVVVNELGQQRAAAFGRGLGAERVRQRRGDAIDDRRAQQEVLRRGGLGRQHLFDEEPHEVVLAVAEPRQLRDRRPRQRRQSEPGNPPAGLLLQRADERPILIAVPQGDEELPGFLIVKPQSGGAHLDDLLAQPHARQGEGRVAARRQEQMEQRRRVGSSAPRNRSTSPDAAS